MKRVYLFRGEPETGKSGTANEFIPADSLVAADDFPEFHKTGKYAYIESLQKESHRWCFERYQQLIKEEREIIGVHNTFMVLSYMDEYINEAIANGYIVKIVHCEAVIIGKEDGKYKFAKNDHNVPEEVVRRMRNGFQLFRSPAPGISITEVAQELTDIWLPDSVFMDWDKTSRIPADTKIKFPTLGETIVNPQIASLANILKNWANTTIEIHIISNQRGITFGHKTVEELTKEYQLFLEQLANAHPEFKITSAKFAISPETYLEWVDGKLLAKKPRHEATKPGIGMVVDTFLEYGITNKNWFIGDAHLTGRSEDWGMIKKLREKMPELVKFRYIPIECLKVATDALESILM